MSLDLDDVLDDFGGALGRARAPRGPRRRTLLAGGAFATGAVAVAAVLLLSGGGGTGRFDAVAQAQAVLYPPREIVHLVVRTHNTATGRGIHVVGQAAIPQTTEQWYASDPSRWRFVQTQPKLRHGGMFDAHGKIFGRTETAYADGAQSDYIAQRDTLSVDEGFSEHGYASRPLGIFGNDLDLRALLASGRVHDRGLVQSSGRTVRRLVGTTTGRVGRTLTYDVDPTTFAPIAGSMRLRLGHGAAITTAFTVLRYERLPDTPANASLLRIATTPKTRVARFRVDRRGHRKELCGFTAHGSVPRCPSP